MWYAAVRRVGDNAHQKIVIALPAKAKGRVGGASGCGVALLVWARVAGGAGVPGRAGLEVKPIRREPQAAGQDERNARHEDDAAPRPI